MKDWLELAGKLGLQLTPWVIVLILVLFLLRKRLETGLNALLDWLGKITRSEMTS